MKEIDEIIIGSKALEGPFFVAFKIKLFNHREVAILKLFLNPNERFNRLTLDKIVAFEQLIEEKNRLSNKIIIEKEKKELKIKIPVGKDGPSIRIEKIHYDDDDDDFTNFISKTAEIGEYHLIPTIAIDTHPRYYPLPALRFESCVVQSIP